MGFVDGTMDSSVPLLSWEGTRHQSRQEESSTPSTIVFIPDSSASLKETSIDTEMDGERRLPSSRTRQPVKTVLMATISQRLRRRKLLQDRLGTTSDIMSFLGILGVLLMVIGNEILFSDVNERAMYVNWSIRLLISLTTAVLVGLVFYYQYLDLSIYAVNNSLDHWRIGLSASKTLLILLEVLVCAIHPFPRLAPFFGNSVSVNSTATHPISPSYIAVDVALGVPMFARLYLLCRSMVFHSPLFRDASSQSLGSLNQVSMNFPFLVKTHLTQWPTRCLLTVCVILLVIGSWSLRACNCKSPTEHMTMLDSMWLFIVTFTTVGYGDFTPSTYCGRMVAAVIALVGVLSTALLISVLTQKLELTRAEKYVHTFVLKIGLAKQRKTQAANVVKFAVKLWCLRRKGSFNPLELIRTQRKLHRSVHARKQLNQEQQRLVDTCLGLPELVTIQRETIDKTDTSADVLMHVKSQMEKLEMKLAKTNQTIAQIETTLAFLAEAMTLHYRLPVDDSLV